MIVQRAYNQGGIYGFLYEFGENGGEIPWHDHLRHNNPHNIIVLRGVVDVQYENAPPTLIFAGSPPLELPDPAVKHLIRCVAPESLILNLYYNGRPADWIDHFTDIL